MEIHHKDALATVIAFVGLVAAVHAGIWFRLFGIPDITIMNWPFHYFWFVVGTWLSLLVGFTIYNHYASRLDQEKRLLRDSYEEAKPEQTRDMPEKSGVTED